MVSFWEEVAVSDSFGAFYEEVETDMHSTGYVVVAIMIMVWSLQAPFALIPYVRAVEDETDMWRRPRWRNRLRRGGSSAVAPAQTFML